MLPSFFLTFDHGFLKIDQDRVGDRKTLPTKVPRELMSGAQRNSDSSYSGCTLLLSIAILRRQKIADPVFDAFAKFWIEGNFVKVYMSR